MSKFFTKISVQDADESKDKLASVWSTSKIDAYFDKYSKGEKLGVPPFIDGDIGKKAPNLPFQYQPDELEEFRACAKDVVYFANKYASAMTDEGIQKITLRDYQVRTLADFQHNRYVTLLASRQVGKCHYPLAEIQLSINGIEGKLPFYQLWRLYSTSTITEKLQYLTLDLITYLSKSKQDRNIYRKTLKCLKKKQKI